MTRRLSATLVALAIALAGCGDDDDPAAAADDPAPAVDDETTTPAPEPDDGDEDRAAAGSAVTVVDFAFDPGTIEATAGSTVTWANEDGVAHTVTAGTPEAPVDTFDERVDAGATVEVTFDQAGTFAYFCAIHPSMVGEVVVS